MIRIVIAEDHQSLIDGIRLSVEYENDMQVVGEANDGLELLELVRQKIPEVVITDIRMPKCDGITATRQITSEFPQVKVVAFSMFEQAEAVEQMRHAGAAGYIMKNSSLKKMLEAVRIVASGKTFFDDAISGRDGVSKEEVQLSSREKEILRHIGEGRTSQEIADLLFIGKSTVDTHRKNILRKMNIHGKNDLIRFAVERKYEF